MTKKPETIEADYLTAVKISLREGVLVVPSNLYDALEENYRDKFTDIEWKNIIKQTKL